MIAWCIGRFPEAIISRHTFAFEQTRGHKSSAVSFFSLSLVDAFISLDSNGASSERPRELIDRKLDASLSDTSVVHARARAHS